MYLTNKYRKIIIYSVISIVLLLGFYYWKYPLTPKLTIHGHTFSYEIALTPEQRELGLSYRQSLPQNKGMLFVFQDRLIRTFWMREMRFPLDFVWIDGTKVVDLHQNVPVLTNGTWTTVVSKSEVNRVLELNAGTIARTGITVGDEVKFGK